MEVIQYRAADGADITTDMENRSITGYGIVFNSDSTPMSFWDDRTGKVVEVVEQITPDSLKGADMRDVISAFNHDFDKILGRTVSGSMKLNTDPKGVRYTLNAPNTGYANDVLELLRRGDLRGSSFVFTMDWDEGFDMQDREDGKIVAIPKKIKKIYEMGPVIFPAYPETTAENRSDLLGAAVKKFLDNKAEQQRKEESQEEVKVIQYPSSQTYKAKVRVMKLKNKRG